MILGLDGDDAHTYMKPITSSNNISWHICRFPHQIKEKKKKQFQGFFIISHKHTQTDFAIFESNRSVIAN